jgi:hypothetical protein
MNDIKEFPLGEDGLKYIEACLENKGICTNLRRLPLAEGKVYAVLPEHTDPVRVGKFSEGSNLGINPYDWLAKHVSKLSALHPNGTFVVHHVWGASPGDPGLKDWELDNILFNQTDTYNFAHATDVINIERAMHTSSFLFVGIFTEFPIEESQLTADRFVSDDLIDKLAQHTLEIYVSAYDAESFVIWRRG